MFYNGSIIGGRTILSGGQLKKTHYNELKISGLHQLMPLYLSELVPIESEKKDG